MDWLIDYGMFLAKSLTIVVLLLLLAGGVAWLARRARSLPQERLEITSLNRKYDTMALALTAAVSPRKVFKHRLKTLKQEHKRREKSTGPTRHRVYLLNFEGDIGATAVASLREEISAILSIATPQDEVVVRLESRGGMVHGYGLAASQLHRLREHHIPLTVAVDLMAASGGYMMACVADRILAAPFAIVGSIGVATELPNFNRFLRDRDIAYEQITAGEYKRTLSLFGENTEHGRAKVQQEVEETHQLFKEFVQSHRPQVEIERVATGEHWYGQQALDLKLVDAIRTSDDYLREACMRADVYAVCYRRPRRWLRRLLP